MSAFLRHLLLFGLSAALPPVALPASLEGSEDQLYLAQLRPLGEIRSTGWGVVTLKLSGAGRFCTLSVSLGGLSDQQTGTDLYFSKGGEPGKNLLSLRPGIMLSHDWNLDGGENFERERVLRLLEEGNLWARAKTLGHPLGELFGNFDFHTGKMKMVRPPDPPPFGNEKPTTREACRFLLQASFGPTAQEVERVKQLGFEGWIDAQFKKPASLHLPYVLQRREELIKRSKGADNGGHMPRNEAWWQRALSADDQLRQRMAFALSEVFVVSEVGVLEFSRLGLASYYDLLVRGSFGNFRDLLEDVTLSPIMGQYLSMVRNRKPDPKTGRQPDENYAREVMQLFTIGLSELHLDGTLKLNAEGMPIPTYTQDDVVGLAHVFTGWGFYYPPGTTPPSFLFGEEEEMHPMVQYPAYHDRETKRILRGNVIAAGQSGERELAQSLNILSNHPNVGPFLAKLLIQRFVTSNPSPGYVFRVASAFNDNGHGVRGDLKAVLKAILLDYEARSAKYQNHIGYGKLKEPLLRLTQAMRAGGVKPPLRGDHRFFIDLQYIIPHQTPLKSPSVFNFFQPGFSQPGKIAVFGFLSPEFQIASETTLISEINTQSSLVDFRFPSTELSLDNQPIPIGIPVEEEKAILNSPNPSFEQTSERLLNHLEVKFLAGRMSPELKREILSALRALPQKYRSEPRFAEEVARMAIHLVLISPEYAVQR